MKNQNLNVLFAAMIIVVAGCQPKNDKIQLQRELQSINLLRGNITLCGSESGTFGKVGYDLSCIESVRDNFNLATALLHSFEYTEAEKVYVKVIDEDPECVMAYWGIAMSNFHPLWAPPTPEELEKGYRTISPGRSLKNKSKKESDYLNAAGALYDDWQTLDHQTRILKFEKAAENIYNEFPDDKEAAVFYALALRSASDPTDKSFTKQRKAGEILNALFPKEPDHPGIAHYLIHTYDYPELATLALPAARKYASIAATSAHALHMPSHIFTRLGLWDEAISSNLNSVAAAQCYAENSGIKGHWDEELHGIDYLIYAYLQQARDELAKEQLEYLRTIEVVFPVNFKDAYTFAAAPTRYALERKDWAAASKLELTPAKFPWDKFPWERSIVSFGRVLGAVHLRDIKNAKTSLGELLANHAVLVEQKKDYEAHQVQIQIMASEAWIQFLEGNSNEAKRLMAEAATLEDATEKHPVTPGEVIPARELLGDMLMEMQDFRNALVAFEADVQRHPGRFNALFGAAMAATKSSEIEKANKYFQQLNTTTQLSDKSRPEFARIKTSQQIN